MKIVENFFFDFLFYLGIMVDIRKRFFMSKLNTVGRKM